MTTKDILGGATNVVIFRDWVRNGFNKLRGLGSPKRLVLPDSRLGKVLVQSIRHVLFMGYQELSMITYYPNINALGILVLNSVYRKFMNIQPQPLAPLHPITRAEKEGHTVLLDKP